MSRETKQVRKRYQNTVLRYTPKPYSGRLTLLVAEEELRTDPSLGWEGFALGGIELRKIPGNHKTHLELHSEAAAEEIKTCLDAAQASG